MDGAIGSCVLVSLVWLSLTLVVGELVEQRQEAALQARLVDEGQQRHALPGEFLAVQVDLEVLRIKVNNR